MASRRPIHWESCKADTHNCTLFVGLIRYDYLLQLLLLFLILLEIRLALANANLMHENSLLLEIMAGGKATSL